MESTTPGIIPEINSLPIDSSARMPYRIIITLGGMIIPRTELPLTHPVLNLLL